MGLFTKRRVEEILKLIDRVEITSCEDLRKRVGEKIIFNTDVLNRLPSLSGMKYEDIPKKWLNGNVVHEFAKQGKVEYDELTPEMKNNESVVLMLANQGKVEYTELTVPMMNNELIVEVLVKNGQIKNYAMLTDDMQKSAVKAVVALVEMGKVEIGELREEIKESPLILHAFAKQGKLKIENVPVSCKDDPSIRSMLVESKKVANANEKRRIAEEAEKASKIEETKENKTTKAKSAGKAKSLQQQKRRPLIKKVEESDVAKTPKETTETSRPTLTDEEISALERELAEIKAKLAESEAKRAGLDKVKPPKIDDDPVER